MLCQIRHAEIGFDASKIMILNLRIKKVLAHRIKIEDKELEKILDEDRSQTLAVLGKTLQVDESTVSKRLKVLGMIQKPYELKPRDVERRFVTCELLLQRQKSKNFLHRIVAGDEKWIHYDNPKRRKSWSKPDHASTSSAKPNNHGSKLLLCIWWDQQGVSYYKLLKANETITGIAIDFN